MDADPVAGFMGRAKTGEFAEVREALRVPLGDRVLTELARRIERAEREEQGSGVFSFFEPGADVEEVPQIRRDAVEEGDCRPGQVILEVTETSLMRRPGTIDDLREAGFRVMIDDFGTGYSTFGYLRDLEIDGLKIDMTLVQGITRSELDAALVETMSALGQGFLFGRPGPLDEGGGAESE